jgi:hypothetical protein
VGEYSPLLGRSFGEIAGESRSQHKSQGFGALQRKGPIIDNLTREATRVNEATVASTERSLFDGIDTSWTRFRANVRYAPLRAALDSLPAAFVAVRGTFDALQPERSLGSLARVQWLLEKVPPFADPDLLSSGEEAQRRVSRAVALALGVSMDVAAPREVGVAGRAMRVAMSFYNGGTDSVVAMGPTVANVQRIWRVPKGGAVRDSVDVSMGAIAQPWWLARERVGDMFASGTLDPRGEGPQTHKPWGRDSSAYAVNRNERGAAFAYLRELPRFRFADQVKGEISREVASVPMISVTLDQPTQFAVANADIDRVVNVRLAYADDAPRDVRVSLVVPKGLVADSATRTRKLNGYGAQVTVAFRLRGRLAVGDHRIDVIAESDGQAFASGYTLVDYDHIRRQRIYRPASVKLIAVDVKVPTALKVAYVAGVGDNVAPTISQLGIPITMVAAADIARADLSGFSTVVVGPRAYEAHPELMAANPKLFEFARKGGVLLVQYGQYEMTQPGVMPFPITLARPAVRVTEEDAVVTIDAPNARELSYPNKISASDFDGWVQERSLYMPSTFDTNYRTLFSMHDANELANKGAVLIAPLGDGLYVYSTLSFFRQLPAGVPGGARLFVNLLSAKLAPPGATP